MNKNVNIRLQLIYPYDIYYWIGEINNIMHGQTIDISAGGVLFIVQDKLQQGTDWNWNLYLEAGGYTLYCKSYSVFLEEVDKLKRIKCRRI